MNRLDINSFVNGFILDQLCRIELTVTDFVTRFGISTAELHHSFQFEFIFGIRHVAQYRDIGDCDSRRSSYFHASRTQANVIRGFRFRSHPYDHSVIIGIGSLYMVS